MSHILINKSFIYDKKNQKNDLFSKYYYNSEKGYWINKKNNNPLMHESNDFKPRTKKEDVETGEDRKGE